MSFNTLNKGIRSLAKDLPKEAELIGGEKLLMNDDYTYPAERLAKEQEDFLKDTKQTVILENIRKYILKEAEKCVLQDRNQEYGEPENAFDLVAEFWTSYLESTFSKRDPKMLYPEDIAMMMNLFKVSRQVKNPMHADNYIDMAGYAACAADCVGALRK